MVALEPSLKETRVDYKYVQSVNLTHLKCRLNKTVPYKILVRDGGGVFNRIKSYLFSFQNKL